MCLSWLLEWRLIVSYFEFCIYCLHVRPRYPPPHTHTHNSSASETQKRSGLFGLLILAVINVEKWQEITYAWSYQKLLYFIYNIYYHSYFIFKDWPSFAANTLELGNDFRFSQYGRSQLTSLFQIILVSLTNLMVPFKTWLNLKYM